MSFRSLIDSPTHKNEYFPSPPPSPQGFDDFQEDIKYSAAKNVCNKNAASSSSISVSNNQKWFNTPVNNTSNNISSKPKSQISSFKPLFPNLFSLNVKKGVSDLSNKKLKQHAKPKKSKLIECYTCEREISSTELEKHLLFGSAKCPDCNKLVEKCSDYSACKVSSYYGRDLTCPHNVWEWLDRPVDYLKIRLSKKGKSFIKSLSVYIRSLQSLKSVRPYKKAIAACDEFLQYSNVSERSQLETRNANVAISEKAFPKQSENYVTAQEKCKASEASVVTALEKCKSPKLEHRPKKRKSSLYHNIDLPKDGHYLIEKEPIEECPNCYSKLNPEDLVFNIDSWLISVICKDCYLNIYFVLKPPDGSEPRIKITLD